MAVHACAIFLSAFLLFAVQPLAGKQLLPWFGGSAEVWSACLLFFQAALFLGYLYAHLLGTRVAPRRQGIVHLALLAAAVAAAVAAAPAAAVAAWRPPDESLPVARILAFLAATVGLPYFVLSANGPLLQRWYTLRFPGAPWRLYALSNLGSLLGLLSYPFAVEPRLGLPAQRALWTAGFALFAAAAGAIAVGLVRAAPPLPAAPDGGTAAAAPPDAGRTALVIALPLTGALLMAATTHHLCQNVAVVPLLWILPLALYLVSFTVVFAGDRCYRRGPLLALLAALTAAATATLYAGLDLALPARVAILLAHLFVGCLVLHGELARLKPPPRGLTAYYLQISAGGAAGTALVTFAAPALFSGYWEYHVALAATWAAALVAALRGRAGAPARRRAIAAAASLLALVAALRWQTLVALAQTVRAERNFYGALLVVERDADRPERHRLELSNGGVVHGSQLLAPALRRIPTVYYGSASGLVAGIAASREGAIARGGSGALRIGLVGLGVGTLAAHTVAGDALRAYELNPAVLSIARENFTFLADARGAVEVVLGDARLQLERELAAGRPGRFDLLVIDAFTGDAIPAHLLTRECLRLYLAHLAPGGRLMLHISNRYLDLRPLALGLARDAGLQAIVVDSLPAGPVEFGSVWATLIGAGAAFSAEERALAAASRPPSRRPAVVWTDEHSDLFTLLEWRR